MSVETIAKRDLQIITPNRELDKIMKMLQKSLELVNGAKSKATYYANRDSMVKAIKNSIQEIDGIGKEFLLILANLNGATGYFIQEALLQELKRTTVKGVNKVVLSDIWDDVSYNALNSAMKNLERNGIPYVLRFFKMLKKEKVNNSRTRNLILKYILGHKNIDFIIGSGKYTKSISEILTHVWGVGKTRNIIAVCRNFLDYDLGDRIGQVEVLPLDFKILQDNLFKYSELNKAELARLILLTFKQATIHNFLLSNLKFPKLYFKAKEDVFANGVDQIPFEVLIGNLSDKHHPQHVELWSSEEKRQKTQGKLKQSSKAITANQQLRQTKKSTKQKVTRGVNMKKVTDFMALYQTGFETGFTPEICDGIDILANKRKLNLPYQNIGIILDDSYSMTGHKIETKNHPKAISLFTSEVIKKSAEKTTIVKQSGGNVDLAEMYLELLEKTEGDIDVIFVISDGYENVYDGLLDEVVESIKDMSGTFIPMYHISPVVGAEVGGTVRKLSKTIGTIAVSKPEGIELQMNMNLLSSDPKRWLKNNVKKFIK